MKIVAALGLTLVLLFSAAPAQADIETDRDGQGPQRPALDVLRGKFTYADRATARVRLERISKRRTRLVTRFFRPSYYYSVETRFRDGELRTNVQYCDSDGCFHPGQRGVVVRWNWQRDTITTSLSEDVIAGRRVNFYAFSLRKGALHGPPRGDVLSASVRRY